MRKILSLVTLLSLVATPPAIAAPGPADRVDPFMGTPGGRGQLSPAAAAPFGMVQLGPDTDPANHVGYDRAAPMLRGFSLTRAQGVGCAGGGGDLLASVGYVGAGQQWKIDRKTERAGAGWYHVRYGAQPITADLSAGQSVSISRFTISRDGEVEVALDPTHSYAKHHGHTWMARSGADLRLQLANATVCNKGIYHLSLAARITLNGREIDTPGTLDAAGALRFGLKVRSGDRVELRTALSTVDPQSAHRTLAKELGDRSLEQLRAETHEAWNDVLSRIAFQASGDRRILFYTCLFRALQMPSRIDDSDGAYRGSDGLLRQAPAGHHRYSGWSLWDNYRTQVPLVALVAPDVASDVADSLVTLFRSTKAQWATATEPFLTVRTEHAGVALLDLYRKKLGSENPASALKGMADETAELPQSTPDQKLELAYDQWAVAQLASDTGNEALARDFTARALAYREMWQAVFRDLGADADIVKARGLYEGTLWQYRWAPVFDLGWMRDEALGPARYDKELAAFFDGKLFNMTNEPDIHAPFLFALTDRPDRTDRLVAALRDKPYEHWYENKRKYDRPLVQRSFSRSPGFAEGMDDDGGAMSAWYVWASLGLYPLVPGDPFYVVTTPAADATIRLAGGNTLRIVKAKHGSITFDGRRIAGREVRHADLMTGGTLAIGTGK